MERAFKPFADATVSLVVAQSSAAVAFNVDHNGANARLLLVGSGLVFVEFGASDVVANSNDMPIYVDGAYEVVYGLPNNTTHCAAYTPDSPPDVTLYVTPGDGE